MGTQVLKKVAPIMKIVPNQPTMPPLEKMMPYLQRIWDSKILSNGGAISLALVDELKIKLEVKNIELFSSGTLALIAAIKTLGLQGEVITTPYTFAATTNALIWNNLTPIFVDIEPNFFNIDPKRIEAAITPRTSGILAVHCCGNPCNVKEINRIALKHNLKVIYDAAHAFGVSDKDGSILKWGDISVLSLHATKVFGTGEGGAALSSDDKISENLRRMKNFGLTSNQDIVEPGFNGKISEINCAFGLAALPLYEEARQARKVISERYRSELSKINGILIPPEPKHTILNYGYFPILITDGFRNYLWEQLLACNIVARRYFYPLMANTTFYRTNPTAKFENLPVSNSVSEEVLCLPTHSNLTEADQDYIIESIAKLMLKKAK